MRRVRVTRIPPQQTATWYGWTRPCKHCVARILRHRPLADGPRIEVLHAAECPVLKEAKR